MVHCEIRFVILDVKNEIGNLKNSIHDNSHGIYILLTFNFGKKYLRHIRLFCPYQNSGGDEVLLPGERELPGIEQMYWRHTYFADGNLFIRVCHPRCKFISIFDEKSSPYWNSKVEEFSVKLFNSELKHTANVR